MIESYSLKYFIVLIYLSISTNLNKFKKNLPINLVVASL